VRALIQRVSEASVRVDGEVLGAVGPGLVVLVCAVAGDDDSRPAALAGKVARLRVFRDAAGKMNLSLKETGGAALVVSQFTLAADTSRGNRPGFSAAADPVTGERLYLTFAQALRDEGVPVATGRFGADMKVSLVNDGPVTIMLDV
jgi:D-tyrosyl-tRNA(Tyr) deacylase